MFDTAFFSAAAAALSALFAGFQIRFSRRDANNRLVFEHLREIDTRIQAAWAVPTEVAQEEVLAYYRRERTDLTEGAKAFLALLNSLDLLAFAVQKKLVDSSPVDEYVRTVVSENVISQTFLREFQKCCGDEASYEHLYSYFTTIRAANRKQLKGG
ncbi:MAG: hypothetical protein WD802_04415 [Gemmatimonadaceae bacterium]